VFCDYYCEYCKFHYSFVQEILEDSILDKLRNTKQKCPNCGHIIEGIFNLLVPPLWEFVPSGDEDHQILKFNNSECIVLSHIHIRIELSDLIKSGFSGRIDIFDKGTLVESIKVRNIFQDYLINKYRKRRRISLGSEIIIPSIGTWTTRTPPAIPEVEYQEDEDQEDER
jgi:hypothetical protein